MAWVCRARGDVISDEKLDENKFIAIFSKVRENTAERRITIKIYMENFDKDLYNINSL